MRRARPEELATIGEVTVSAYEPFLLGGSDPYADRLRDAAARDLGADLYVAVADDDQEILGTVTLCPEGSAWREIALPGEGELRMLAVAPGAQGRGVGGALAELCVDRFREAGMSALVLSSLAEMIGAHRIYERLGFARCPDRDWEPHPGTRLIAYWKDLRA